MHRERGKLTKARGMPMQGKLIASVPVLAQTQPQQKNRTDLEASNIGQIVFFLVAFFFLVVALTMRQTKQRDSNNIQAGQDKQYADDWKQANLAKIKEHRLALYEEFDNGHTEDQYGNRDYDRWMQYSDYIGLDIGEVQTNVLNNKGFRTGWPYFWKNVLVDKADVDADQWFTGWFKYNLSVSNKLGSNWYDVVQKWIDDEIVSVAEDIDKANLQREEQGYSEDMSGADYEIYCGRLLHDAGWNVEQTQASNDQGVDLIAQIEDLKVCIQCKRYSNPVGNKAVQEVIAGKAFYNGTHAVVVSNAGFTKAAKSLAESADVILISDTELEDLETMI